MLKKLIIATSIFLYINTSYANADDSITQALQDLHTLSSDKMAGRATGTEGNALAREYILQRIQEIGLQPCNNAANFIQEFTYTNRKAEKIIGKNIISCQMASNSTNEMNDQFIVISAHYDHLGSRNGAIYHGADDNASGVSAALAIATNLQKNPAKHNIMYTFFDAEEQGKLGAFSFVKDAPELIKKVAININFDMIARGDKGELYASGTYYTPELIVLLQTIETNDNIKLLFGHDNPEQGKNDWTTQSDHHAFHNAGVPHIYFGVEDHPDYHKPSDTSDKINAVFFEDSIQLLQKSVNVIDQALVHKKFTKKIISH